MHSILTYLLLCPLVGIAGFVDAIAGGGGLISLPAYLIAGIPVHNALGTNKLSSTMGTTVATVRYARSGFIPWQQALLCVLFALAGSSLGAKLALTIPTRTFSILMLVILPLTACYLLRSQGLTQEREPYPFRKTLLISLPIALVLGVYDGFYGPGTGTFLLLLLTGVAHLPLNQAAGLTKAINLATNVAALTVFLRSGVSDLSLGLVAGCFGIAGNYLGSRLFVNKGAKWTKPLIVTVLVIFFCKVCYELVTGGCPRKCTHPRLTCAKGTVSHKADGGIVGLALQNKRTTQRWG